MDRSDVLPCICYARSECLTVGACMGEWVSVPFSAGAKLIHEALWSSFALNYLIYVIVDEMWRERQVACPTISSKIRVYWHFHKWTINLSFSGWFRECNGERKKSGRHTQKLAKRFNDHPFFFWDHVWNAFDWCSRNYCGCLSLLLHGHNTHTHTEHWLLHSFIIFLTPFDMNNCECSGCCHLSFEWTRLSRLCNFDNAI